ncbi:MAG: aliphatic sulfonate ABC transporter substrate-binding protein [Clostridiales bacterium]|nr:aliphatic sulfonate ABC transporter substrate-binding protein [Clostridiales bacterium]
MLRKKIITTVLAAALALSAFAACSTDGEAADQNAASQENRVVRIAAQSYPLYSPLDLAYDLGYVDEELNNIGVTLEWTEFASGPLVNEAIAAGEGDLGFMADLPAIIARSSGQDIQVVSNISSGERSLAVLVPVDSDITDASQLAGKRIAYAFGSYAQHLLALVLDGAGLTFDDVESVNLGAADSPTALAQGDVDAIVIWEQFITKLTLDGTARVLVDGTGIKKSNMILYAVSDYASANPDVIEALIRAIDRGIQYISSNPDDAASRLATRYSVTPEEMNQILGNFEFYVSLSDADIQEITTVADYAYEAGIISNPVNADEFINTTYLTEAGF